MQGISTAFNASMLRRYAYYLLDSNHNVPYMGTDKADPSKHAFVVAGASETQHVLTGEEVKKRITQKSLH